MPSIQIGFNIATAVVLLFAVAAFGLAFYFYRVTLPPVPPLKRWLLIILRGLALTLVLMLLFEPLLRLTRTSIQPPVLAVLVDASKSMTIQDKTGNRTEILNSVLQSSALRPDGDVAVRYYMFGASLDSGSSSPPTPLTPDREATDISAALRLLGNDRDRLNIKSAVLLTDGSYNLGQNPLHEAERLGLPLFTIGIGDSSEQKDVVITRVVTNELVFAETEVPVDVTVKSSGYGGETVEVLLLEEGRDIAQTTLTLQEGTREYALRLSYIPQGEGTKRYTVRVSSLPGELTTENNRRTFFARVLKSRMRVLMLAGGPGPDVSILKQTLVEEKNIEVQARTQRAPSGFYEGELTTLLLDSADCLLLIGFPTPATTTQSLQLLQDVIARRSLPVFFIDGKTIDYQKLSSVASVLPFTVANPLPAEQFAFLAPSTQHRNHPVLDVGGEGAWDRLPPLFRKQTAYRARPEAVTLGVVRIQNVATNEPLLVTRSAGRQKSLALLGYGLWRWRLMAQGNPDTERVLSHFLANSLRWLTTREESRPVKVTTTKELYTQGEPVEFTGQVYDANARPVDNAHLRVTVRQEGKELETVLRSIGNGRYEGTMEGMAEGEYAFQAGAVLDGQSLGDDRGRFAVGELSLEFLDTRMNAPLLRQLAARTGGGYFTPDDLSQLKSSLATLPVFEGRELRSAHEVELWNWQYMLALIVSLFALEWFIRKRNGML